jgi:outer membrane protein assembly factor BamB
MLKVYQFYFCFLILLFSSLMFVGCSHIPNNSPSRRLVLEKQWVRDTPNEEYYDFRRVHRMPPVLTKSMVIAGNSIDGLVAYDRKTAKELWRFNVEGGVEAGVAEQNEFLYFGAGDGFFYKIEKWTGRAVWSFPIRAEGLGQPTIQGNRIYFLAGNNVVYALDTETGKSAWLYNRRDPANISVRGGSRPSVDDSHVYVGFSDGSLVALKKATGTVAWETLVNKNKRFQDIDSHPFLDGETIYIAGYDNSLQAINKKNGDRLWQVNLGGYSMPLKKDSSLYYSSTSNKIVALDKDSGQTIWSQDLRSLGTQPEEFLGLIIVGEYNGSLKLLDMQTGELVKEFHPGRGVHSKVTIDRETGDLYFMSSDGNLFVLNMAWSTKPRLWPREEQ